MYLLRRRRSANDMAKWVTKGTFSFDSVEGMSL